MFSRSSAVFDWWPKGIAGIHRLEITSLRPKEINMLVRAEKIGDHDSVRLVNIAAFETPSEANLVDALPRTGVSYCVARR